MTVKRPTTVDEQISILKNRGLVIIDDEDAKSFLLQVNYYRFSGYTKLFSVADKFENGITFDSINNIYKFDEDFKNIILKYIFYIEVLIKTQIANVLSLQLGELFYKNKDFFNSNDHFKELSDNIDKKIDRFKDEKYIQHYEKEKLPIWVLVEVLSFSDISMLFANLKPEYQKLVSTGYLNTNAAYLKSYLYSLTTIRNSCAHGARVYGKYFEKNPRISKKDVKRISNYGITVSNSSQKVFIYIYAMFKIIVDKDVKTNFIKELKQVFNHYNIDFSYIGFPQKWESLLKSL